ncbi:J domain-containing protein [Xenophilus aerolatus]
MTVQAYPLQWPAGWKRTPADERAFGRFGTTKNSKVGSWRTRDDITIYAATVRLREELQRVGVRDDDMVLSTNLRLRLDGLPRSDQAATADPGAAVYWTDVWTGAQRCMAIDRYTKVEQNIAALAATIEALRAIERHGGAIVLERAFTGFAALPPPISAGMARPWWEVLDVPQTADAAEVQRAYRSLAAAHHPDRGGDAAKMAELNAARDAALRELA